MIIGIDASRGLVNNRTGTEEYSYRLITQILALPESQKHLFFLYIRQDTAIPTIWKKNNVIVKEIKLRYLWTQVGLAVHTWSDKIQVLFVPAHTLPVLRKPGIKTVVTIHGLEYKWLPEYRNLLQRWYLPLSTYYAAVAASRLIAVSDNTKRELLREVSCPENKISVIYEGVDSDQYGAGQQILDKYGLENKRYILFVGTLQPRKNLVALIRAYARVKKAGLAYKLVLAGAKGWMSKEIFAAVEEEGLEEKVVFTGRISQQGKAALLHAAALYVQSSITEGFGIPVLEAMIAKVPVVSSNGGALGEVVAGAGEVVKLGVRFEERLANAIVKVIENESLRQKMVERGVTRVRELTWHKAAIETLRVLETS